jgi:hypothetical protein
MRALRHLRSGLGSLALAACCATSPALATATATPVELGSDGTIYRLWSGTFGELFGPDNTGVAQNVPVLALDIAPSGQPLVRHLVPGTEDAAIETSAALLFDRSSASVHAVWNSRTVANLTISRLHLRSFAPEGWTELIELSGGSLTDKAALQLALTSDEYSTPVAGVETRIARRVLHLVWSETVGEVAHAYYSPVVFANGRYLGWNPVVSLDDLAIPDPGLTYATQVPLALRAAPTLVATPGGEITASFVHSESHQLVAVEVQTLPGELGELAEMARGQIVELAAIFGAANRAELATMARGQIVELAGRFHPSAASYIGDRTSELLAAAEPSIDDSTLGEMARGQIVELGREILGSGLANLCTVELLLEVPPLDSATIGTDTSFSHLFAMRRVARWEVPADLVAPDARILVSADGSRATVAWSGEGHLFYREVDAGGEWSPVRDLDLALVSLAEAWNAIERRASGR